MFLVKVACSDESCAEEFEAVVERLEEVDDVVCECDSGTVLVSVAELDTGAQVIQLRLRREDRPLAA
jgi:hypothetical protein